MKTYEEMAARVFQRRDEYEQNKRRKFRRMTRAAASLTCVTVLGLAAHSVLSSPEIPDVEDPLVGPNPEYMTDIQDKETKDLMGMYALPCTTVTINESELMAVADMDVKQEEQKTYPTHRWIPGDWKLIGAYTLSSPDLSQPSSTDVQHDGKRYLPHDDILTLKTTSENEVTIAMCDFEKPLRDCIIMVDAPKLSHIYGIETTILHINDLYNAQFAVNGLYFDIELICQTSPETGQSELIHLLEQIIFYEGYYKNLPDSTDTLTEPVDPEDIPVVFNHFYEAVDPADLSFDLASVYGGAYYNDAGDYVVILTEDTPENREAVAAELDVDLSNVTFETGVYTLAYLTELQETISLAMQRREIPFVISSALYESKNRIGICVNVTDIDQSRLEEDYLSKVYAMDSLGGAIEVELVSGTPKTDLLMTIE
ncbi:MAG: hypothetical protein IJ486_10120 [Firmicutes bacterium]|nr:hypothetical protein [Bacillota bacterium]